MSELNATVSRNIRRLREERGLSASKLAALAGVSKQALSLVERGSGNPTVATLDAVARALDVPARALLSEWGTGLRVLRAEERTEHAFEGATVAELDSVYGYGWVATKLVRLARANGPSRHAPEAAGTLHQVWVASGSARLTNQGHAVDLREGDLARVPADRAHEYEPLTDDVLLHVTTTVPHVPQVSRADHRR